MAFKTLARNETALHVTADAFAPKVEVAVRYAFARGRKALGTQVRTMPVRIDAAVRAIKKALGATLPKTLFKVYVSGGRAAAGMMGRSLEFNPNQPRDEKGQWTSSTLRAAKDAPVKKVGRFKFTFNAASDEAIDWADRHAAELIDGISETSREQINNAIAEALESGTDAYDEILDAVGDPARAQLIAHHEVMLAVHEGQREAWRQAEEEGLLTGNERPTWIITGDNKVCPICESLDGKTRALDGEYRVDGESYPGPPAHPRCRCTEGLT